MTLEERGAILAQEILALKRQVCQSAVVPWWEQINGVCADTSACDEAADLGRQYRESQRPREHEQ